MNKWMNEGVYIGLLMFVKISVEKYCIISLRIKMKLL